MEYYIFILVSLALMLVIIKLVFCELEGRAASKNSLVTWYNKFNQPFKYVRTKSIIFMCVLCYIVASIQPIFTTNWLVELIGFVATGVISDGLSQLLGYHYNKIRFRSKIQKATTLSKEIKEAMNEESDGMIKQSLPVYSCKEIAKRYFNEDTHLAFISYDGGEFVNSFDQLPPITYVVDAKNDQANELLADKSIKVTKITQDGKLPFKDERIDVIVNELSNYSKYELYRVVKPGGYIIVDQLGSDNYKEITNTFLPFKLKGRWDKEAGCQTLSEIGLEIVDSFEEVGFIRFDSLTTFIEFMKGLTRADIKHERFMNFYSHVLNQIKENKYFELTTHRFLVVARKKEL